MNPPAALESLRKTSLRELENLFHLDRKARKAFREEIEGAVEIGTVRASLTRAKVEAARLAQGAK